MSVCTCQKGLKTSVKFIVVRNSQEFCQFDNEYQRRTDICDLIPSIVNNPCRIDSVLKKPNHHPQKMKTGAFPLGTYKIPGHFLIEFALLTFNFNN